MALAARYCKSYPLLGWCCPGLVVRVCFTATCCDLLWPMGLPFNEFKHDQPLPTTINPSSPRHEPSSSHVSLSVETVVCGVCNHIPFSDVMLSQVWDTQQLCLSFCWLPGMHSMAILDIGIAALDVFSAEPLSAFDKGLLWHTATTPPKGFGDKRLHQSTSPPTASLKVTIEINLCLQIIGQY